MNLLKMVMHNLVRPIVIHNDHKKLGETYFRMSSTESQLEEKFREQAKQFLNFPLTYNSIQHSTNLIDLIFS